MPEHPCLFVSCSEARLICGWPQRPEALCPPCTPAGAAARRDIGNLVGQPELVDAGYRITAADERVGALRSGFGDRFGHGARTGREFVDLEHAHRTVPEDRLALEYLLAEDLLALVGDVHAFPAVGNVVGRSDVRIGVGRECVGDQRVGRHHDLHALLLGLGQNVERRLELIRLADRVADLAALRSREGIGHAAAQHQHVDLFEQVLDDGDLGRNLRTAQNGAERTLRIEHDAVDGLQLVLHHVAEHLVVGEIVGDQGRRGVCAVRRAERVVDVAVGIRCELLDELLLRTLLQRLLGGLLLLVGGVFGQTAGLALLLGVETQVLQQHHLAGLEVLGHLGGLLAHAVAGEHHLHAQTLLDGGNDLLQRELGIGILLGTSQMRHQDHRTVLFEHFLDRGDRRTDTGVVRHLALFVEGHIEIHADDCALAFEIVIVDCEHSSLILNYFDELIFQFLIPGQIYINILEICYSDNRKNDAEPGPEGRKSFRRRFAGRGRSTPRAVNRRFPSGRRSHSRS